MPSARKASAGACTDFSWQATGNHARHRYCRQISIAQVNPCRLQAVQQVVQSARSSKMSTSAIVAHRSVRLQICSAVATPMTPAAVKGAFPDVCKEQVLSPLVACAAAAQQFQMQKAQVEYWRVILAGFAPR